MLMIVFLFTVRLTLSSIIMRLTLSSLLWDLPSLHYYEAYSLFRYYEGLPSLHYYEAYPLFRYYEAYPLFVIMRLTLSSLLWGLPSLPLMCSCCMLYNSDSILLFFANHAFFKYDKPINMKFHRSSLHNLNPNCSTYLDTLNQFNTFHSCIIS
jgi:hypothetical protein